MSGTPFDSIEGAQAYVTLLKQQVAAVQHQILEDMSFAADGRHLDALRLVEYKLIQLASHLATVHRILNDLRSLRRLLLTEQDLVPEATSSNKEPRPMAP